MLLLGAASNATDLANMFFIGIKTAGDRFDKLSRQERVADLGRAVRDVLQAVVAHIASSSRWSQRRAIDVTCMNTASPPAHKL